MNQMCNKCHKRQRVDGYTRCIQCIEYYRNYRQKAREAGKCTSCNNVLETSNKTCNKCLDSKKQYYTLIAKYDRQELKEARITDNLCITCGIFLRTEGTLDCEQCKNIRLAALKERRLFWEGQGLCVNCGQMREDLRLKRCLMCTNSAKRTTIRRKLRIIKNYGTQCACCEETQFEFLCVDHIHGDGTKHRKEISSLYGWLIGSNFPEGYRILCINCNFGRSRNNRKLNGGCCPHKTTSLLKSNVLISSYTAELLKNGASNRKSDLKLKLATIDHYGGLCACCGVNQYEFLSIDHIEGRGREHVQTVGNIYYWLKDNKYPKDFRVLCMNCNQGREINGGECPHNSEKKTVDAVVMSIDTYQRLTYK